MAEQPIDILSHTHDAFIDAARARGVRSPVALDAYHEVFRSGSTSHEWIDVPDYSVHSVQHEGATVKFTLAVGDGLETESVILPQRSRTGRVRHTLCVSSQIGCAMGCRFCETAQMGLMRNLSVREIIAQWHAATFQFGARITNIVFMGMGEPMVNLDAVIPAIRLLADHHGPMIAASKISVSTVGRAEGIRRLAELAHEPGFHRLSLAVSINASNDAVRSSIMPINRATPLAELREAMRAWPNSHTRRLLIEYVLIPGVNDDPEHADELCEYLRPLYATVNVIPYNPIRNSPWEAPSDEQVERFLDRLIANGQFVTRRRTMGRTLMAACGQLGNPKIRRRTFVDVGVASTVP